MKGTGDWVNSTRPGQTHKTFLAHPAYEFKEETMEKKAYYARPISIDNTPQAERDIALICELGFMPHPAADDKKVALDAYKVSGMVAFRPYVQRCAALFFRAFPDGSIGAGVAKEIAWAEEMNIPVVEIPRQIARRTLSVDDTKAMLAELGQR
jgi:hypothetical protein